MSLVLDDVLVTSNPATGAEVGRVASRLPSKSPRSSPGRGPPSVLGGAALEGPERGPGPMVEGPQPRCPSLGRADPRRDRQAPRRGPRRRRDLDARRNPVDDQAWGKGPERRAHRSGLAALMLMPAGRLRWGPVGVVGMIGTWNYPLFLNAPPIAQALAAGNAVVWKPSELAIGTGQEIQKSLEEAGVPSGLVTAVFGGAEVGQALVQADLDKGMFTGGIASGRRVLAALGAQGVPAVAELSGFDPAIILPDAPRESTVRALTWAAFVGCGQTCVAVKRIYVVGDPQPWSEAFAAAARALKVGDPSRDDTDLGPMITEAARDRFDETIKAAVQAGARVLAGGTRSPGPAGSTRRRFSRRRRPRPRRRWRVLSVR